MPFQYVGCDVSSEECTYNPLEYFIDVFQEEPYDSADNYYCDRNNIATAYLSFHTRFRIDVFQINIIHDICRAALTVDAKVDMKAASSPANRIPANPAGT